MPANGSLVLGRQLSSLPPANIVGGYESTAPRCDTSALLLLCPAVDHVTSKCHSFCTTQHQQLPKLLHVETGRCLTTAAVRPEADRDSGTTCRDSCTMLTLCLQAGCRPCCPLSPKIATTCASQGCSLSLVSTGIDIYQLRV